MALLESGENYLEMILILQKQKGSVRSVDVANAFDFTKASVSRAMSILKKDGYITVEDGGCLVLTESGLAKACAVLDRHITLTRFLLSLGVTAEHAEKDACRIEHIISQETYDKIKSFIEKTGH